jgi:2-keto-4-pentenoate hydratase/2-oxohepta-3-ene-1,7-dioic acid hydratase in catechol pathway
LTRYATVEYRGAVRTGAAYPERGEIELFDPGISMRRIAAGMAPVVRETAALDHVTFRPPVPDAGKIVCLAGNYRAHIKESGFEAPSETEYVTPQLFLKPVTALSAHEGDIVLRPKNAAPGWEVELAVVMGANGNVFGYTILNDISERRLNAAVARRLREMDRFCDWLAGKWFDTFAPCGPWIVRAQDIPDPHALELRLSLNGEPRQQGNTRDMIARIPELIDYCSSIMTLEPGDIISTGTPAGAGLGSGDSVLRPGDEVVCEIEGIGRLCSRVRSSA